MKRVISTVVALGILFSIAFFLTTVINSLTNEKREMLLEVDNENFDKAIEYANNGDYENAEIYFFKAKNELTGKNRDLEVAMIDMSLGYTYLHIDRYKDSYEYLNRALSKFRSELGAEDVNARTARYHLGHYYKNFGDYENALAIFMDLAKSNDTFQNRLYYSNSAISTLIDMGALSYAKEYYTSQKAIYEERGKTNNRNYMLLLNDEGVMLGNLGEFEAGTIILKKAIEIHAEYSQEEDADLALVYLNLANIASFLGEPEKITEYANKALDIYKKIYGENHLNVAHAYRSVGSNYAALHMADKQNECYSKALEIAKNVAGENHAAVASSYSSLADYYNYVGNYNESIKCAEKAIEIRRNILAGETPAAAADYLSLADQYQAAKRYDEAVVAAETGGNIYIDVFGIKTIHVAKTCLVLARTHILAGNTEDALNFAEGGTAFIEKSIQRDCTIKAFAYQTLGYVFAQTDNLSDAEKYCKMAIDSYVASGGEKQSAVGTTYGYLGALYTAMGDYDAALIACQKRIEIHKITNGEDVGYVESGYHSLGFTQYQMGRYDDALASYNLSAELRYRQIAKDEQVKGMDLSPQYDGLSATLNNIAAAYEDMGQINEAIVYGRKAYRMLIDHDILPEAESKMIQRLHRLYDAASPNVSFDVWLLQ